MEVSLIVETRVSALIRPTINLTASVAEWKLAP